MSEWYWCLDHRRPEPRERACAQDRRLGPYESAEAAARWKERHEEREERWEEQDEAWESWGADAADAADDTDNTDDPEGDEE